MPLLDIVLQEYLDGRETTQKCNWELMQSEVMSRACVGTLGQRIRLVKDEKDNLSPISISSKIFKVWNKFFLNAYMQRSFINKMRKVCQERLNWRMLQILFFEAIDKINTSFSNPVKITRQKLEWKKNCHISVQKVLFNFEK